MKKIITTFFALTIGIVSYAQTTKTDSVVMGVNYSTHTFYSFQTGKVKGMSSDAWDLGFEAYLFGASIIVNHASGELLYRVPNQDTSNWSTLDTTGMNNWTSLFNSDTTWERGAFNYSANPANPFDFGWGLYNIDSNNVYGEDSVYILKIGTPVTGPFTYKKIEIKDKLGIANEYVFRIANLDNTSDYTDTVHMQNYSKKNFVYYNIASNSVVDLEPYDSTWDVLFTQYTDLPYNQYEPPVVGVLSNKGVQAVKVPNLSDINNVNYNDYASGLTTNLSEIGYDWKSYNEVSGKFHVLDSLVYFVKTTNNNIIKLWFTAFNDTTGRIAFDYSQVVVEGVSTINGQPVSATTYPNPSMDNFNVVYSTPQTSSAQMNVFDITGRVVLSQKLNVNEGLNLIPVSLSNVANGIYIVNIEQDGSVINLKMLVSK